MGVDGPGFMPTPAHGPFDPRAYVFAHDAGFLVPGPLWACACDPSLPILDDPVEDLRRQMRIRPAAPSGLVGRACLNLFGPPRRGSQDERGYPRLDDYVLTTPVPEVFLTVRLDEEDFDRFGVGVRQDYLDAERESHRFSDSPGAECRAGREALLAAMRAIRTETVRLRDLSRARPYGRDGVGARVPCLRP